MTILSQNCVINGQGISHLLVMEKSEKIGKFHCYNRMGTLICCSGTSYHSRS